MGKVPYLMIVALTLAYLSCAHAGLDSEHKCLSPRLMPGEQCDLTLTYGSTKVGCGEKWTNSVSSKPKLSCTQCAGKHVLVYMIDHDLPFPGYQDKGYVHWIAKGEGQSDGTIMTTEQIEEGGTYEAPYPPYGQTHRYDVYVFEFDANQEVRLPNGFSWTKSDKLCDFKLKNRLDLPIAAMMFRYST